MTLDELFAAEDYAAILEQTEKTSEPSELFYRLSALLMTERLEEAMALVSEHRAALYEYSPIKTLKADFEIRFALDQFDEAFDDLEEFRNLPYACQEAEEYMRDAPKRIRKEEKDRLRKKEPQTLATFDDSTSDLDLLSIIAETGAEEAEANVDRLLALIKSKRPAPIRTLALLVLRVIGYDKEVSFAKRGLEFTLIPSGLPDPFADPVDEEAARLMEEESKDPSIAGVAKKLHSNFLLERYPEGPEPWDPHKYAIAFVALAAGYLSVRDERIEELSDDPEVEAIMEKIADMLDAIEPVGR